MNTSDCYICDILIHSFAQQPSDNFLSFVKYSYLTNTRNAIDVESFYSFNYYTFGVPTSNMLSIFFALLVWNFAIDSPSLLILALSPPPVVSLILLILLSASNYCSFANTLSSNNGVMFELFAGLVIINSPSYSLTLSISNYLLIF